MSDQLPSEGPERQLFLIALREFSEGCAPPSLHPACPFAIDLPGESIRGCGEECMDLLAEHRAPPPLDERSIDGEYAIRRVRIPRARRGPTGHEGSRPFDARQRYFAEIDLPVEDRSVGALLHGLGEVLATPPGKDGTEREKVARALYDRLLEIGLGHNDVASHVANNLGVTIAVLAGMEGDDEVPALGPWVAAVDPLIDAQDEPPPDRRVAVLLLLAPVAPVWLVSRSIESWANWQAPSADQILEMMRTTPDPIEISRPTWLAARFAITYLSDWPGEALEEEWRYLHGQFTPPLPPSVMRQRTLSEADVAKELANNVAIERREAPSLTSDKFTPRAADLLDRGRYEEAALVFEALVDATGDPTAVNNLGFCLMPLDMDRALSELERAMKLGYPETAVNMANRILILSILGRFTAGLDLAERALGAVGEGESAYLWGLDEDGGFTLRRSISVKDYVTDLALGMVHRIGDTDLMAQWEARTTENPSGADCD